MESPEPFFVFRDGSENSSIQCVRFIASDILVSGHSNGAVKVWNAKTKCRLAEWQAHSELGILNIEAVGPGLVLSQGRDGLLKLWDVQAGGAVGAVPQSAKQVHAGGQSFCKFSVGRRIGDDGTTSYMSDERNIPAHKAGEGSWHDVALTPTAEESQAALVDLRCLSMVHTLNMGTIHCKTGMCTSLYIRNNRITGGDWKDCEPVVGFENGFLAFYDLRSSKFVFDVPLHPQPLLAVDFDPSQTIGVSGGADNNIHKFKHQLGQFSIEASYTLKTPGVSDIRIRDDGRLCTVAGWDHRVRIFAVRPWRQLAVLRYHRGSVYSIDCLGSTGLLASGSKDGKLALWSVYPPPGSK